MIVELKLTCRILSALEVNKTIIKYNFYHLDLESSEFEA